MTLTTRCSICHMFPVASTIKAIGGASSGPCGICDMCFTELTCPSTAQAGLSAQPPLPGEARLVLDGATGGRTLVR